MTTNYRDGQEHQVGPFTFWYTGPGEYGPTGIATIAARGNSPFSFDYLTVEAIARIIKPTVDLWNLKENDMKLQPTGEVRGNLLIELTDEAAKLGDLAVYADQHFYLARLAAGAELHQVARRTKDHRTKDYSRSQYRITGGYAPQGDTRKAFVDLAGKLARNRHPDLPMDWEESMLELFWAADATYEAALGIHAEIEDEDAQRVVVQEVLP